MTRAIVAGVLLALAAGCPRHERRAPGLRIVSLVPSVTEVVYALGAQGRLVGNTTFCDYPEPARQVYKVGDFLNPDVERIASLAPSLVFLALPAHRLLAEKLSEMGIATYVSRPRSIDDIFREIDSVGRLLGVSARAQTLAESLRSRLDELPAHRDTPSVYVEISDTPLMTAGAGAFLSGLIERAGGRNLYGSRAEEYPLVDPEFVVREAPEVILILHPGTRARQVRERLGWANVPAVRNDRVFDDLDVDVLSRPGPRIVEAVYELSRRLHPEQGIGGREAGTGD